MQNVWLKWFDFEVEFCTECKCDVVTVFDGPDDQSPVIGSYCGYDVPNDIVSTGRDLFVRWTTDEMGEYRGFMARYGGPHQETGQWMLTNINNANVTIKSIFPSHSACTASRPEVYTAPIGDGGIFYTPGYPNQYPNNADCQWLFNAENGVGVSQNVMMPWEKQKLLLLSWEHSFPENSDFNAGFWNRWTVPAWVGQIGLIWWKQHGCCPSCASHRSRELLPLPHWILWVIHVCPLQLRSKFQIQRIFWCLGGYWVTRKSKRSNQPINASFYEQDVFISSLHIALWLTCVYFWNLPGGIWDQKPVNPESSPCEQVNFHQASMQYTLLIVSCRRKI